jgi:hypothetical protein
MDQPENGPNELGHNLDPRFFAKRPEKPPDVPFIYVPHICASEVVVSRLWGVVISPNENGASSKVVSRAKGGFAIQMNRLPTLRYGHGVHAGEQHEHGGLQYRECNRTIRSVNDADSAN